MEISCLDGAREVTGSQKLVQQYALPVLELS